MNFLNTRTALKTLIDIFKDIKEKTILDIGAGEGYIYDVGTKSGAFVTGIDPALLDSFSVDFKKTIPISFEDFNTISDTYTHPHYFDAAVCINTFPFIKFPREMIFKMVALSDVCIFNIWGKNHSWSESSHITTFTREEVEEIIEEIEKTHEVISFNEIDGESVTKKDPHTKIPWHTFDVVIKKK